MRIVNKTIALAALISLFIGCAALPAYALDTVLQVHFENETETVYLPVGERLSIKIKDIEYHLVLGGTGPELYHDGESISCFSLWRASDPSVVDFSDAHKAAWPSDYASDPTVLEDEEIADRSPGYIAYHGYGFNDKDVSFEYYTPEYMYKAEIEGKSRGVSQIKAICWKRMSYYTSRGVINVRTFLPCDVDDDGEVTVSDALLALRMYVLACDIPQSFDSEDVMSDPYLNVWWIRDPDKPDFIGRLVASYACDEGDDEYNELTIADALAILRRALGLG